MGWFLHNNDLLHERVKSFNPFVYNVEKLSNKIFKVCLVIFQQYGLRPMFPSCTEAAT